MFEKGALPFDRTSACRLIAIAQNDNLRNLAHAPNLPVQWTTLYELTKLTDEQFKAGIKSKAINSQMQRKDVKALRETEPKAPKKKVQTKPSTQNLRDWCFEFSDRMTIAFSELLTKDERRELSYHIRKILEGLETKNGQ
jgi:hypothetical protein